MRETLSYHEALSIYQNWLAMGGKPLLDHDPVDDLTVHKFRHLFTADGAEPTPHCETCGARRGQPGYITFRGVPEDHPLFGKAIPCPNCS